MLLWGLASRSQQLKYFLILRSSSSDSAGFPRRTDVRLSQILKSYLNLIKMRKTYPKEEPKRLFFAARLKSLHRKLEKLYGVRPPR